MTNSFKDFAKAKQIMVIGSNMTEAHPVAATFVKDAVLAGAKLIVIDPRRTPLVDFADLHVQIKVGSDVAFLNGVMNVLIEGNLYDRKYVESCTAGFDDLAKKVKEYPPEKVAKISGVSAETIRDAARRMAAVKPAMLMYTLGITEHTCGVDNVMSCANLQMLLGNVGFECGGVNPLRGQNNVQGACDMGALPDVFPGYQAVTDPEASRRFAEAWGVELPDAPGLTVTEAFDAIAAGAVRALYVMGENPMLSDPDQAHVEEALRRLDFLVVQDIFLTETAALADVVLPAASFAEKDGTFTNTERRVQLLHAAVPSPGEARADWRILTDLARRLGAGWHYSHPREIMAEVAALTPSYGGISHERLEHGGLCWPCPDGDHPGTPILHVGRFTRGLGKFFPVAYQAPAEEPDDEYPLSLTTGRMLEHYHTGTMTRRSDGLNELVPEGFVEVNPADAAALGFADGASVAVETRRGRITITAHVTTRVRPGTVFVPFHFWESPANRLTNPARDPLANIPEFKVCGCRIVT